ALDPKSVRHLETPNRAATSGGSCSGDTAICARIAAENGAISPLIFSVFRLPGKRQWISDISSTALWPPERPNPVTRVQAGDLPAWLRRDNPSGPKMAGVTITTAQSYSPD